jgi:Cu+-exporting ATPase
LVFPLKLWEILHFNFFRGDVIFDPQVTTPKDIAAAIDDMGFDATVISVGSDDKETTLKLTISGMTCASCVRKIEMHLQRKDGIEKGGITI